MTRHPHEPITRQSDVGHSLPDQMERFQELTWRDLYARSIAALKERDQYDPTRHGDAADCAPLTLAEHLEVLALGDAIGRHFRHPAHVDQAVKAGASWRQIAQALGEDEQAVREAYRSWADGQRHLHQTSDGAFGLSEAEHAAAIARAGGEDR
ncbi:hypothetical protein [Actinoallomurus sp. CA-150999]|uniref:hypothetical protein n=1 Tax=Actinoallomurus sp. CA-150999 TaxID=3239887 RepID=UPI003D8D55A5